MTYDFASDIRRFNEMYKLPAPHAPTLAGFDVINRLQQFQRIINNELDEGKVIEQALRDNADPHAILTDMADWFGDLCVYATSEALRYGIVLTVEHYDAPKIVSNLSREQRLRAIQKFTTGYAASVLSHAVSIDEAINANKDDGMIAALTGMLSFQANYPLRFAADTFGLPMSTVLGIIMQSNFSKLGADGLPIYDSDNKVQKGPNYWKPEPKISEMLQARILEQQRKEAAAMIQQPEEVDVNPDAPDA